MLTKLILFSAQQFIKSWLENGLTMPSKVAPDFILLTSSLDKGWLEITRSELAIQSSLLDGFKPRFSKSISEVKIPSPIPCSKKTSPPKSISAEIVSGWIGDLRSF